MEGSTVVRESQVDWLTAATHTRVATEALMPHAGAWLALEQRAGNTSHPWHLMGYVGSRAGRVRLGFRGEASLLQLSGDLARAHYLTVDRLAATLSRVDLAVTVRCEPARPTLGLDAYEAARAAYILGNSKALPKIICDAAGGTTLYVGDRTSNIFLRLYDKEQEAFSRRAEDETTHYQGCWRYEVEYKGERAAAVRRTLANSGLLPDVISDLVAHEFHAHAVQPIYDAATARRLTGGFRRRSDNDRRLSWFRASVAPAVKALLECDRRADVEAALGLTPPELPF